jgi:hypothetical protein
LIGSIISLNISRTVNACQSGEILGRKTVLRKDLIWATTTKIMGIQTKGIIIIRRQTSKVIHRQISEKIRGKYGNTNVQNGRYRSSGRGYVRLGSFGIRYHGASRASDNTEGLKRHDDELITDDADFFWFKMRNMLENMKRQKRIASASSLDATKVESLEASRDGDCQGQEQIEFYCILCLKLISTDSSLQNTDESYFNCSEAAIKEHIKSLPIRIPALHGLESQKIVGVRSRKPIKRDWAPMFLGRASIGIKFSGVIFYMLSAALRWKRTSLSVWQP